MNFIIKEALKRLPFNITLIKVYVDDTFLIAPEDSTDILLQTFNSVHEKIQFTMEVESDQSLPFLDTLVTRNGDHLTTEWYSNSDSVLHYMSYHPFLRKLASHVVSLIELSDLDI